MYGLFAVWNTCSLARVVVVRTDGVPQKFYGALFYWKLYQECRSRMVENVFVVVVGTNGVPQKFYGALLIGSGRRFFSCPYYGKVPLSLPFSPRVISVVAKFKPHIIHASSLGIMVLGTLAIVIQGFHRGDKARFDKKKQEVSELQAGLDDADVLRKHDAVVINLLHHPSAPCSGAGLITSSAAAEHVVLDATFSFKG
ncbi:hypothetical protein OROHE_017479 [Orobanche hederae]